MSSKLAGARSGKLRVRPDHLTSQSSIFTRYIGKLKVGPREQLQISLGVFGADRPEKGFSVSIDPDPTPYDSVVSEVLSIGSARRYELFLSVANFSDKLITAEIWAM